MSKKLFLQTDRRTTQNYSSEPHKIMYIISINFTAKTRKIEKGGIHFFLHLTS